MKKINVLVCGATGFIGRNIVQYLIKDNRYNIIGVWNKRKPYNLNNLKWVKADLTKIEDVNKIIKDIDIVIHAAATTSGSKDIVNKPEIHVTDNVLMNSLVFRAAKENNIKHVIFFSCTVMLQSNNTRALTEEDFDANKKIHPKYFGVGWTKVYSEKMCEFYSSIGETKFTVIRHSNIYGPFDKFDLDRSHVFGATITKVMTNTNGKIIVWGSGEEARDLLYVDDLANFVSIAIDQQTEKFGIYNCGYGEAIKIKDLVKKIILLSKKDLIIEHDLSLPSINTSLHLDCSKAKKEEYFRCFKTDLCCFQTIMITQN